MHVSHVEEYDVFVSVISRATAGAHGTFSF
jgi:hypothetical protein